MKSRMAMITFFGDGEYPSNALPGMGRPVDPGYGIGEGGHPSNSLPGGGHISTLPVFPFDPTLKPDNDLPSGGHISTGPIVPGKRFIVKWLACYGLILVPDNTLPETPEPK